MHLRLFDKKLYLNSKLGRLILLIRSLGNLVVLISSEPITRAFSHLELQKNKRRPSKKKCTFWHMRKSQIIQERREWWWSSQTNCNWIFSSIFLMVLSSHVLCRKTCTGSTQMSWEYLFENWLLGGVNIISNKLEFVPNQVAFPDLHAFDWNENL